MTHDELNEKVISEMLRLAKSGATIKLTPTNSYTPSVQVIVEWSDNLIVVTERCLMPLDTLEHARDEVGLFAGYIENSIARFTKHLELELNKRKP